ncbi:hypothetical protein FYC62_02055 [Pedobacter aquae]|uniref:Uncharacterized protein n=1 Tax=Pedobacter aquae TaxID=2605747 RepID=A0A5C0VHT8_9SPHI|nr:hypothetical protein [Pedobacter aquae]QEK50584.1 hypothetical protein FYC62_02055 [Pedobacter aquae]
MIRIIFIISALCLTACSFSSEKKEQAVNYYNLQKYFSEEAARLNKIKPGINKTVKHNHDSETQNIKVEDWIKELALFVESDINKVAWKNSYQKDSTSTSITYTAKEENLRTRKIIILLKGNKPSKISITNQTKNNLYYTKEELIYIPDSLYQIEKFQDVKVLGINNYQVKGVFN